MILVDVNILIYSVNADSILHAKAKNWLGHVIGGPEIVGFSWSVLIGFLRLTTRAGLFREPLTVSNALEIVVNWLDQPSTEIVNPGYRHFAILHELLSAVGTGGNLTSDAHLAALTIEHGARLFSTDRDFARFPSLRWANPLE